MPPKRIQVAAFFTGFVIVAVLVFSILKGYLPLLAFSFVLAILFAPVYNRLLRRFKDRKALSAALVVALIFLMIVVPLWLFGQLFVNELISAYTNFTRQNGALTSDVIITKLPESLREPAVNFNKDLSSYVARYTSNIFQGVSSILSNVATFLFSLFLLLFTTYYLLKDKEHLKRVLMQLSPIAAAQEQVLIKRIANSIRGVMFGTFLVALVQGVVATTGFLVFGLPNAILWGCFTVVAAVIPLVGTAIIIVPAILFLLLTDNTGAAIGLTLWGSIAVGLIDNLISPKLVGSRAQLHPVLVMFGVIGGLQVFGFLGFLLGPILMAVFMALIDMYRTDFQKYLEE